MSDSQRIARMERDMLEHERREFTERQALQARNAQLLEALTLAHSILLHEMDNGRTPTQLQGVGLGYFEDVIAGLDDAQFRRE